MKQYASLILVTITALSSITVACGAHSARLHSGENLFKLHCQPCHPEGMNVINPAKTLHPKDLHANNITTADAILKIMRGGATGMMPFNRMEISDTDAQKIAEYILQAFK